MNAIQSYIENLFKPLPDSREVRRLFGILGVDGFGDRGVLKA